ncbi:MAG: DUF5658 family protein [Mariniblastus sp.]|nr:DUF5658 family protein [Mariniblastus sp.]
MNDKEPEKETEKETANAPEKKGMFWTRELPLQTETCVFILINSFDVFMTWILLGMENFRESNGIANWILIHFQFRGMVYFKFSVVLVVVLIAQVIATRRLQTAQRLLNAGSLIVLGVVIYSVYLFVRYGGVFY